MALCPFHHDPHPNLKLNEDSFFCFGCGANGDVIDFTARLFGLCQKGAAQKLAVDFGLNSRPPAQQHNTPPPDAEQSQTMERLCIFLLSDYLRLPIDKLQPFENHPFHVKDDAQMDQLVWSILAQGLLTPITVRPPEIGEYEVISDHRRLHACQKAGIKTVPA